MTSRRLPTWGVLGLIYAFPLLFLAGSALLHEMIGLDFGLVSRDPASTFNGHPLVGMQSTISGFVYFGGVFVASLALAFARRARHPQRDLQAFLVVMIGFTTFMGVDDIFMIHDGLAPLYLNIDERPITLMYVVGIVGVTVGFRKFLLRTEPLLFLLAVGCLAGSVAVDHFQEALEGWPYRIFFEDGFKFLGVCGWTGYLVRCTWLTMLDVARLPGRRDARPSPYAEIVAAPIPAPMVPPVASPRSAPVAGWPADEPAPLLAERPPVRPVEMLQATGGAWE